jgi:hypothetical protein
VIKGKLLKIGGPHRVPEIPVPNSAKVTASPLLVKLFSEYVAFQGSLGKWEGT